MSIETLVSYFEEAFPVDLPVQLFTSGLYNLKDSISEIIPHWRRIEKVKFKIIFKVSFYLINNRNET